MNKIKLLCMVILIMLPTYALAETYQIKSEIVKISKDDSLSATCEELLEVQKLKNIVIEFIKGDRDKKIALMSEKYIDQIKEITSLYPFMRESITRIEFNKINIKKTSALLKIQISWFSEGYDGVQTIYFDFVKKEASVWLIDWVVF